VEQDREVESLEEKKKTRKRKAGHSSLELRGRQGSCSFLVIPLHILKTPGRHSRPTCLLVPIQTKLDAVTWGWNIYIPSA